MPEPEPTHPFNVVSTRPSPETPFKRTAEVRWFYEGEPPVSVTAWFQKVAGADVPAAARTDLYLLTSRTDLNVKHREGRLEVKRRLAEGRTIELAEEVVGVVERWDKWIQPGPNSLPRDGRDEQVGERMVAIWKERRLITLSMDGETLSVVWGVLPRSSCNLELTRIGRSDQHWWSVCFEASGPESELEKILRRAIQHAFSYRPVPSFDARHSFSYPAWLLHASPV